MRDDKGRIQRVEISNGTVFGRLTVLECLGPGKEQIQYRCQCSCGNEKITVGSSLRNGSTTSCGCYRHEQLLARNRRRRIVPDSPDDPIVAIWRSMIFRCHNPKSPAYPRYGGRGIVVCERWRASVQAFMEDMGPRPSSKYTIERIDGNGHYEPANCRWATRSEQARNRPGRNVYLTCQGETKLMVDWARQMGMSLQTLSHRIKLGWSHERAILTPVRPARR